MLYTPKEIANFLVQTYGDSLKGIVLDRDTFEMQANRYCIDHRLVRSIDLELRPMGYVLFDLLKEQECVVMMSIRTFMETLAQGDIKRAG
jgi:hypothetical protein